MFSLGKALVRLMKVTQSLTSWPRDVHPRPSSIKRFCQTSRFPAYRGNHWRTTFSNVFVFAWLLSSLASQLSFPADVLSHRCAFSLSFALLWTCCERMRHVIYRDRLFLRQATHSSPCTPPTSAPLHRHSSSSPLSMQTRHSWCFFLFFFCCEPRYSLIYDLAFSGFRWTSHHFPPKPDSHVGILWPQNAERGSPFFFSSIQTVETPDILFISGNLTLLFSSPIPPFSLPPHPHSILNNIYI